MTSCPMSVGVWHVAHAAAYTAAPRLLCASAYTPSSTEREGAGPTSTAAWLSPICMAFNEDALPESSAGPAGTLLRLKMYASTSVYSCGVNAPGLAGGSDVRIRSNKSAAVFPAHVSRKSSPVRLGTVAVPPSLVPWQLAHAVV